MLFIHLHVSNLIIINSTKSKYQTNSHFPLAHVHLSFSFCSIAFYDFSFIAQKSPFEKSKENYYKNYLNLM